MRILRNGLPSLLPLCFLLVFTSSCRSHVGKISIRNESKEELKLVTVKVCEQFLEWKSIPAGSIKEGQFRVTGDSHYEISATYLSGKKINANLGYVTNGMDFSDSIHIFPAEIQLRGPTQSNSSGRLEK